MVYCCLSVSCSPHTDNIKAMKTFQVILSQRLNPGFFKFITVEDCVDLDDCVEHIMSTEKECEIEQIREIQ